MSDELKPCPFCGGPAKRSEHYQHESGDVRTVHVVGCHNRDCGVRPTTGFPGPWGYRRDTDPPSNEAVIASAAAGWNRRAPQQTVAAVGVEPTTSSV